MVGVLWVARLFPGGGENRITLLHGVMLLVCTQSYSMGVYLVKQQSSMVLLQRLRAKGIRNPDHSRALSKNFHSRTLGDIS